MLVNVHIRARGDCEKMQKDFSLKSNTLDFKIRHYTKNETQYHINKTVKNISKFNLLKV